ncbi:MAG TPA: TlpA disulfide reductase family protein [Gammaproteobacteria bacterium]|nr:TlpA disulfide reductase family protein [Gammaproteobacteria bacterium]
MTARSPVRRSWLVLALAVLCLGWAAPSTAGVNPRPANLVVADGTGIPYTIYAPGTAGGPPVLLVWLPSEAGVQPAESRAAMRLAQAGIEVWMVDPLAGRFLPTLPSAMDRVPAGDIQAVIAKATGTGRKVYLIGAGRGAIPVLRGARRWQRQNGGLRGLAGTVLISPKLFVRTPDPGEAARLMPVVRATNLPIYLIQPAQSPWHWKLGVTVPALERSGSDVFVQTLHGVRDRFYFRPDASARETALGGRLPQLVWQGVRLLATLPPTVRTAAPLRQPAPAAPEGKSDRELKPYGGNPQPPALRLPDLDGRVRDLQDYRGRVVLVNFWASWCPPCVHEMPSMERLQEKLAGSPFSILAVNMAESRATVQRFVDRRGRVDFPVVLDSDGAALRRWGVFAFPTSFVIGPDGRIRYALFGAFDWDRPAVVAKLRGLMKTP